MILWTFSFVFEKKHFSLEVCVKISIHQLLIVNSLLKYLQLKIEKTSENSNIDLAGAIQASNIPNI